MAERDNPLIVAVDTLVQDEARQIIQGLQGTGCRFKLGHAAALGYPNPFMLDGSRLFLDLKFHDTPSTVHLAVTAAVRRFRPWALTVHACGGAPMMRAAVAAAEKAGGDPRFGRTKIIGVTVLTSAASPEGTFGLAHDCAEAGLDGIVCSPQLVRDVRRHSIITRKMITICPGIRDAGDEPDDQRSHATAAQAAAGGADYAVVGRPITRREGAARTHKVLQILESMGYGA